MCKNNSRLMRAVAWLLLFCTFLVISSGCGEGEQEGSVFDNNYEDNIVTYDSSNFDFDTSDNITTYDTINIKSWSEVDEYSDLIYSAFLFDDITDSMPVVECRMVTFDGNDLFDNMQMKQMLGEKFDLNSVMKDIAIGSSVLLVCAVLHIATAGMDTPFACFISVSSEAAITSAFKSALAAARKEIVFTILEGGSFEDVMYGAIESSADAYKWGAVFGAITGKASDDYCFTGNTLIQTENGKVPIETIDIGSRVYSFDAASGKYSYKEVTQLISGSSDCLIKININGEIIESTPNHPFFTENGWRAAEKLKSGMKILCSDGNMTPVIATQRINFAKPADVYSVCVKDNHSFLIGNSGAVVHNGCIPDAKFIKNGYHFPSGTYLAKKYPNGISFDKNGFPNLKEYAVKTVKFDRPSQKAKKKGTCLTGNRDEDFKLANRKAGFDVEPAGYTWHHCSDKQTMQLVPTDLYLALFGGAMRDGSDSFLRDLWSAMNIMVLD